MKPFLNENKLVARVVPNALDLGPQSASLNALRTTRATTNVS